MAGAGYTRWHEWVWSVSGDAGETLVNGIDPESLGSLRI